MFLSGGNLSSSLSSSSNAQVAQAFGSIINGERSIIGNVLNVVRFFGTGIAIILLTYMAISYFTADGRGAMLINEKKADIKGRQLKQFAIGAFIFIAASNILYYISQFVTELITEL
jgi:hypothetical protein